MIEDELIWGLPLWKSVEINEFNNNSKNDLNVLKRINKWNRLSLTRKLKILILFETSNGFLLILKSLSHNNNVKEMK